MERQLEKDERFLTPEREQQTREVIERACRRNPAVVRADGTIDLRGLTDDELVEVHRSMAGDVVN